MSCGNAAGRHSHRVQRLFKYPPDAHLPWPAAVQLPAEYVGTAAFYCLASVEGSGGQARSRPHTLTSSNPEQKGDGWPLQECVFAVRLEHGGQECAALLQARWGQKGCFGKGTQALGAAWNDNRRVLSMLGALCSSGQRRTAITPTI